MKLFNISKKNTNNKCRISVSIESGNFVEKELWFEVDQKYESFITEETYDAFLVGLIYSAMRHGEDIYIDGAISKKLFFNLIHYAIPVISAYSSECKQISIQSSNLITLDCQGKGVGTGFSGGVDSFCTIYDHLELESSPEYKINSFLFLNVGAHGTNNLENAMSKFNLRYDYLKAFPNELGLDFIAINSNLHSFHPWGHQESHTLTSVSGVLVLQKMFRRYYYASAGLDYSDYLKIASNFAGVDIGIYADPILLPLLGTELIEFIADGSQYNRVEKTRNIINYEPVGRYLNVCVSGDDSHVNCSQCSKCARTMLTLEALGVLEKFSSIFDIELYKSKVRQNYLFTQVATEHIDPYAKANLKLARENRIKLPSKTASLFIYNFDKLRKKMQYFCIRIKYYIRKIIK